MSELAAAAQITERAAYRILSDLQEAGYVSRVREGRRTRYVLNTDRALGDPVVGDRPVGRLFALLAGSEVETHSGSPAASVIHDAQVTFGSRARLEKGQTSAGT